MTSWGPSPDSNTPLVCHMDPPGLSSFAFLSLVRPTSNMRLVPSVYFLFCLFSVSLHNLRMVSIVAVGACGVFFELASATSRAYLSSAPGDIVGL